MSSLTNREHLTKKLFDPFMMADIVNRERMEKKKAMDAALQTASTVGGLQNLFQYLAQDALPEMPHILKIPDAEKGVWHSRSHEELLNVPWKLPVDHLEARKLQYMTVFSTGDRDLQLPQGFEYEEHIPSPTNSAGRSSLDTPQRDPKQKMSFADYNRMRKEGIKPIPRTSETPDSTRPKAHARTASNISNATPMARGSSFEGSSIGEIHRNGNAVHPASKMEDRATNGIDRNPHPPRSNPTKPQNPTNGVNGMNGSKSRTEQTKDISRSKEVNTAQIKSSARPSSPVPTWNAPMKHSLPPRPQSPRRMISDNRNNKRPHESEEQSHIEKRARTDRANSHVQKSVKPDNVSSKGKAPPSNLRKSDDHASKSYKGTSKAKPNRSPSPINYVPPLLSPLAKGLDSLPTIESPKKPEQKVTSSNTPSKPKPSLNGKKLPPQETSLPRESSPTTPPKTSPPFKLPPLLSPTLPDIVEVAWAEFKKEKADKEKESVKPTSAPEQRQEKSGLLTVEERHYQARKPDAPGVARKTVGGAKIGHPPKRSASNTPLQKPREGSKAPASGPSLIVKLPYTKRKATTIERLVRLSPRPSPGFLKLESIRKKDGFEAMMAHATFKKAPAISTKFVADASDSESEEDIPLSTKTKKPVSKKRPSDILPSNYEPQAKRAKRSDNHEVTTARKTVPSLKSPMRTISSQKSLLATPKKSEGSRAAPMTRVTSSDGNPQTPQAANITATTPQSISANRYEQIREFARYLKKKGERMTRVDGDQHQLKPVVERSAGVMVVVECLCQYMRYFKGLPCASPKEISQTQKTQNATNWEGLLPMFSWLGGISKDIPVLQALFAHLHAVCLEECIRAFTSIRPSPGNTDDDRAKDHKMWTKQQQYDFRRGDAWRHSNAVGYKLLKDLSSKGEPTVIGPWTSIDAVTAYCMEVCTSYNQKEKLGWTKEVDF